MEAGIVCVILSGTFLYGGIGGQYAVTINLFKMPDYVVTLADRLLEWDEHPRVIAQEPIGVISCNILERLILYMDETFMDISTVRADWQGMLVAL